MTNDEIPNDDSEFDIRHSFVIGYFVIRHSPSSGNSSFVTLDRS